MSVTQCSQSDEDLPHIRFTCRSGGLTPAAPLDQEGLALGEEHRHLI